MIAPDEFDAFYKDARDRLLLQTYALTGDLPASRSARPRLVHRRLAPLAQDLPACPTRRAGPARTPGRTRSGATPPGSGTATGASTRTPAPPWTRSASCRSPSARRCCSPTWPRVSMSDLAREVGLPRAEAERAAADRDRPVRRPPRRPHHPHPAALRAAARAGRAGPLAAADDHPPRRRRPAPYPHAGRRGRRGRRHRRERVPGHRRGRRAADAGPRGRRRRSPRASVGSPAPAKRPPRSRRAEFDEDILLAADQVAARVPGRRWAEPARPPTTPTGTGRVVTPCQASRFADPRGRATLVRDVRHQPPGKPGVRRRPGRRAVGRPTRPPRRRSTPPSGGTPAAPSRGSSCCPPNGSRASATRRCSWCCGRGRRPARRTSPGSPAPAGSPRRR